MASPILSYAMASSSCSSTAGPDVFLSFYAPDTRYKFLSHLYAALDRHGVRTNKDDPKLSSRKVLTNSLTQAIRDSKINIVVLSKNYASSALCLDELVEILSCHRTMKKLVIPVFYDINTSSVVLKETDSLKKNFKKQKTEYREDRLEVWHVALTDLVNIGSISGYKVDRDTFQADIINQIVDRVLLEVDPMTLDVAKYPVGLASRVESITRLLSSDREGISKIGIFGMGGVGKTTLAKAVYNVIFRDFEGSCFLKMVTEVSATETELVRLQKQLIGDVLKCNNINIDNIDQGSELIKARICSLKVLVIIDDLDSSIPLDFLVGPFASGSVVILTTRDEEILDQAEVETSNRYMVKELDHSESEKLLTHHVFGSATQNDTFTSLWFKDILRLAGGHPLTLEVVGSYLSKYPEVKWRQFIDQLKQCSIEDIEKNLMISYHALALVDPTLPEIFLDIACFFIGKKKQDVVKIMGTYFTFVSWKIDILKKKCLLGFDESNKLEMHDLLQAMGRKIVRDNSLGDPGKYSRLCISTDIYDVLKTEKGTEAVEAIIPSNFYYEDVLEVGSYTTDTFKRMTKLRFLYLKSVVLSGSFEHIFEYLRWLRWEYCSLKFLPLEFRPQKLVALALPHSKIRTLWEHNKVPQVFLKLKTVDMSNSVDLTTTPDFTKLPFLETLNFEGCKSLEEVHISIGSLKGLVLLNLQECLNLKSLPDSICQLKLLEYINIGHCLRLKELPENLGTLTSLKEFDASALSLSRLPDSIGYLHNLVTLKLRSNNWLQNLPDSLCTLRSLENLDLGFCYQLSSTTMLLDLSNLRQLESLNLTDCKHLRWILGWEELTSLRILHLGGCSSSLLKHTLTQRFFKQYSQLGHEIKVYIPIQEFPNWIGQQKHCIGRRTICSRMSVSLQPNLSHKFLGTILYFKPMKSFKSMKCDSYKQTTYSVKNNTSGFVWSGSFDSDQYYEAHIMIVPSSIFSVKDGDHTIELTSNTQVLGIYLLYEEENTRIEKYESPPCLASKRMKSSESDTYYMLRRSKRIPKRSL